MEDQNGIWAWNMDQKIFPSVFWAVKIENLKTTGALARFGDHRSRSAPCAVLLEVSGSIAHRARLHCRMPLRAASLGLFLLFFLFSLFSFVVVFGWPGG